MNNGNHISLGLVFHNHQPVGQSDNVFEEIYDSSYERVVAALERHPGVRAGLHYTGSLLDWLLEHRPEFIARIKALVDRGQVEILSGGYYEPILPSIPDDDKVAQILKLTEAVRQHFGYDPSGMWLAERVWEPTLPTCLAEAGIGWTLVDDIHFKMVGHTDDDLTGYYATENNGDLVGVFGNSKQLRYNIPWRPVQETITFMHQEAQKGHGKVLVMGDDGEKFGAWPETFETCWGTNGQNGWIDELFSAIEANAQWLHAVRLSDYVQSHPALGRVYLPTASYNEMMEWALPAYQAHEFAKLYHQLEDKNDAAVRYMKGGFWRNFIAKYPEVNTQHKKMLRVHDKVNEARRALDGNTGADTGQEDLWRGQSNDTYWHGLFGGVYMTDIRTRVHGHLIRAQQAAERILYGDQNWIRPEITDFDRDSMHELLIEGNALNLYIDLADGGSIFEWDLRPHNYNLASTVTRRPEGYHEVLREAEARKSLKVGAPEHLDGEAAGSNPHEVVRVKEEGLTKYLNYDSYRRACMLDHFFAPGTTLDNFIASQHEEAGDFVTGVYQAEMEEGGGNTLHVTLGRDGEVRHDGKVHPFRVSKRLALKPGDPSFRVLYTLQNMSDSEVRTTFGTEWNINLLGGGHNPTAYYKVEGRELKDAALDSTGEEEEVSELALGNSWLHIEMALRASKPALFWRFPLETVSGSEAGFERTYQGSCVILQWPVHLQPDGAVDIELEWLYRGNRDELRLTSNS